MADLIAYLMSKNLNINKDPVVMGMLNGDEGDVED